MSKIQEALDKIRAGQELASIRKGSPAAVPGRALKPKSDMAPEGGAAEITLMEEQGYRSPTELVALRTISGAMTDSRILNAVRELRTSVLQRLDEGKRIVMVTSTSQRAGSTFVARNLAAAIALDEGKTALIIDCNLKDPSASRLALDGGRPGLREFLKNPEISAEAIIHRTGIARLRVIPAGNDLEEVREFFTSVRLRQLMEELELRYPERYIFVDVPPISHSADARILAEVCDHVLLVVPFGKATTTQIAQSAKAIGKEKFLGLIFNNKPGLPRLWW
ncbi:MAG: polysaccharide biosynthesis protein [Pseudomonadota bacterium]